jgi:hypothetical protein
MSFWRRNAFHRDRGDALAYVKHLRNTATQVIEKRPECGEPLIACPDVVSTAFLEMFQKSQYTLKGEIFQFEMGDRSPSLARGKNQKKAYCIPVASNRSRTETSLDFQMVFEE